MTLTFHDNPKEKLGYNLPTASLGEDPIDTFKRFYRVYPQFVKADL